MHSKRIREKVKQDYDAIAQEFSGTRHFPWKDFDRFLPYYHGDFEVLDVGCGNGRLLHFLEKHGVKDYLGVDQSEALLEHARQLHPDFDFHCTDMAEMELSARYDALFAIASFHHLGPKDQLSTLKCWQSHLKPGGMLFMMNWNLFQKRFWRLWGRALLKGHFRSALLIPWKGLVFRYYYAFTQKRMSRLLRKAGFLEISNEWLRDGKPASFISAKNLVTIAQNPSHEGSN